MEKSKNNELIFNTMHALIINTKEFMFIKDINFRDVAASMAFVKECACKNSLDEVIGKTDFEIFSDEATASKFREDDMHLLECKEPLIEYRETYPNREGKKCYCLTTKYLITNDNGCAIGIYGLCHDITEQVKIEKIEKRQKLLINRQLNIFKALKAVFNVILYCDLSNDCYYDVTNGEDQMDYIKNKKVMSENLEIWMKKNLSKSTIDNCKDFFNLSTVEERLLKNDAVSIELETNHADWLRISLLPIEYDDSNKVTTFLCVSEKIADEVKTRGALKNRTAILNALRNVYSLCMFWNLSENTYFRVSGDENDESNLSGILTDFLFDWMNHELTPQVRRSNKDFFNIATIAKRLKEKDTLSKEIKTISNGWMRISLIPISFDEDDNVVSCLWVSELIGDEKKKELEHYEALRNARHIAETDYLTGLLNRGGSEYLINKNIECGGKGLLFLFDVDNFKHINDEYGHAAGDYILKTIAESMKKAFRRNDVLARFGGDEFVVFIDGVTSINEAQKCIGKLIDEIEEPTHSIIGNEHVYISIGAFFVNLHKYVDFTTAYNHCDRAMYSCKNEPNRAYCIVSYEGKIIDYGSHNIYFHKRSAINK